MIFSSISFLYGFLPLVLLIYFLLPKAFRNISLLLASLVFYAWGEPKFIFIMLGTMLIGYISALMTDRTTGWLRNFWAVSGVMLELSILVFFKYSNFFIENYNYFTGKNEVFIKVALPLGISFYTFQIISYNIDVSRREVAAERNIINLALYVSLFPQLIAGPIVRYKTIAAEIRERKESIDKFSYGAMRFATGLAKKVLLANTAGALHQELMALPQNKSSVVLVWIASFSYAFQIYFDFSGYSDMAIGLGKIFGFDFLENFDHPYESKSITEFWRRWHISLSSWFKDYVYIPLGGNKRGSIIKLRNLFLVWLLTGFWHGASWNFVVWGLFYFVLIMLEKLFLSDLLEKLPKFIGHLYCMFFVNLGWVIFSHDSLKDLLVTLKKMFFMSSYSLVRNATIFYIKEYIIFFIIAVIAASSLPIKLWRKIKSENIKLMIEIMALLIFLTLSTACLCEGSFNPFIYFRF